MRKAIVVSIMIAAAIGSSVSRAPAASAAAAPAEVHIVNGAPNPQQLTINDGDTVTFVNDDDVAHSIWAAGQQRGGTIAPHTRSDTFGPFQTGGQGGRSQYQVDQNGATGEIVISSGPAPTQPPPTTAATTTTVATTTTSLPTTTSTTTTTTRPTTTSTTTTTTRPTTTTTISSSSAPPAGTSNDDSPSLAWLGWAGLVLALVGIGNVIRVVLRPKQHLRPVPVETLATEEPPTADPPTSDEPPGPDEPPAPEPTDQA